MEVTKQELIRDLRENLAICPGDKIIVHSSMKLIGRVSGGPVAVIEALIEAVGGAERGTILMPCMNEPFDVVDILNTPCRLGLIPETFRTFPGVRLSQNHTHRVAVFGKDAQAIADSHIGKSPLGPGSPFHEMGRQGASVLHIGCDFRSCSLIHVAEWIYPLPYNSAQVTYPDYNKTITMIRPDGSRVECPPKDNPGDGAGFLVLQDEMEKCGLIRHGKLGNANCLKARGLDVLAVAMAMLARDPVCLLCENPRCEVCPPKRRIAAQFVARAARPCL